MEVNKLKKGILYLIISSGVFIISGYIINIWLGRYLGPHLYGIYGLIISLVGLINLFQSSGLTQSISKFISDSSYNEESVLKSGLALQIIISSIISFTLLVFSVQLSEFLNDSSLFEYIRLLSLIVPSYGLLALFSDYNNGKHNFIKQSLLSIIYSISKVLLIIPLSMFYSLKGVILGFAIAPVITLLFGFKLPSIKAKFFSFKKILSFSLPLVGFIFLSSALSTIDIILLKVIVQSNQSVGYYTAVQNVARIPFFGLSAFSVILFPSISKSISENDNRKTSKLIQNGLRYILLPLVPGVLMISATSDRLLSLLFNESYLPGSAALSILIIGSGFITLFTVMSSILNGAGKPKFSMIISFFGVLIITSLCTYLIPRYQLVGSAIATTVGGISVCIIAGYLIKKNFNSLISFSSLIRIAIASLIIYLIAKFISVPIFLLPLEYIILLGIYGIILYFLKEITQQDIDLIKSFLPPNYLKN